MKANVQSTNNSLQALHDLHDGKVHKSKHQPASPCKEEDNSAEIKEYLNKLQNLVPFMPKNKKLSKLEVISYVIDYIQDLSETLGLPPSPSSLPPSSCDEDEDEEIETEEARTKEVSSAKVTLSLINQKSNVTSKEDHILSNRQPLSVISNPENKGME